LYQPSNDLLGFGIRNIFVDGANLPGVKLLIPNDYAVEIHGEKNGYPLKHRISTGQKVVDRWVNITWIMTGSWSSVYVDGQLIGRVDVGGSNVGEHAVYLGIHILPGFGPFGSFWPGKVSSLRIYDRVLAQDEVQRLYSIGSTDGDLHPGGPVNGHADPSGTLYVSSRDESVSDPTQDGTREHPYDSIQKAIDVAVDGQTVVVLPGVYFETIDFLGKSISVTGFDPDLAGEDGPPCPVIDGNYENTVVTFASGEGPESQLSGFVITRGKGRLAGGILCSGSSPVITNCLITGNRAESFFGGGGVYCLDSEAVLDTCTISGNYGGQAGAGFYTTGSKAAVVMNSILWDNAPAEIGFPMLGAFVPPVIAYSNVGAWALGQDNIDSDPLFVAPGCWTQAHDPTSPVEPANADAIWIDGDYRLQSPSPCIDAGDPMYATDANRLDLDGRARVTNDRVDMGAYEFAAEPGSTDLTFVADCEGTSILLTSDSTSSDPERTYVGKATIHLDAFSKLQLLAEALPVSAAGGTWTVLLEPEIVGPGIDIEIVISVRGEGVDVSRLAASTGEFVLVEVELDQIAIDEEPGPVSPYLIEDFSSGGFFALDWKRTGSHLWFVTSAQSRSGFYSAQAGRIGHNEQTSLSTTLECMEYSMSFWYRVSSEENWDSLEFFIDGQRKGRWSGELDWQQAVFPVEAGERTFTWTYSKDGRISLGQDTAWIDYIMFPARHTVSHTP
jgi:hypothetical protein